MSAHKKSACEWAKKNSGAYVTVSVVYEMKIQELMGCWKSVLTMANYACERQHGYS